MEREVDVLICGGGPVGLLTAYCLARYGVSTYVVEQHDRAKQTLYGRAAMIAPRTLEMLDQLDLANALGQIGFVVRGQVSYKDGEKDESKTTPSFSDITDTFFDYCLLCRQRYTEDVIRQGYERYSKTGIHYGARLADFSLIKHADDSVVRSTIDTVDYGRLMIRSKYIVGADGGRSTVRNLAGIVFEGDRIDRYWIRIDGIVETDMPEARRGLGGIQSASHGSVLWACLDHGATRVGFALPRNLFQERWNSITRDEVVAEAKKALQPFNLEFKTVDWWTVYSVGQHLAATYRANNRVFIAGDAAHTHSSGAAQGMNTGLHDAVNLSWKLAGHLNGWLSEDALETYATERRPIAQRIIEQDKIISVVTGGEIPEQFKSDPDADPNKILTKTYEANVALYTGLGISYPQGSLLVTCSNLNEALKVEPGQRAPDVLLQRPGIRVPLRLQSLWKFNGKFTILFFCGDPNKTRNAIREWRQFFDGPESFIHYSADFYQCLTIITGNNEAGSPDEHLGVPCFGDAFYDVDGAAHMRYGVATEEPTMIVLRPDGMVGLTSSLGDGHDISSYFAGFVTAHTESWNYVNSEDKNQTDFSVGEVSLADDADS
ncbi:hypothetical protein N7G274_001842 [Stereocaulon virgatum]|uniref:FAD-binding domain-containing protein n=1 Tax=Stereocaulon virgatum TaxID=373712 RepID=A0ABR4AMF2_9LECA